MDHRLTIDSDDHDDDDEIPSLPRAPAAKNGGPAKGTSKKGTGSQKESERKKRELIAMGKAKGFLTYDEVNEHMPESIASSHQMDDWLSAFSAEGIEIVDSSSKIKVAETGTGEAEAEEDEEVEAKKEEAKDEDDADGYSTTSDPVRMYLRKMGSISLLTREGEVEIAKRIEDGERRVLQVVLNSSVAIEEILDLGDKLRKQEIRVKEVVKDADEEDAEFDEQWHVERVCKVIDKVRRLWKEHEKVGEKLDAKVSEATKKKYRDQIDDLKQAILDALQEMRLNKKQIDKIVLRLKEFVERIEQANRELADCERKSGLSLKEFRKTLREIRSSPLRQRAVAKKLGIRPDEVEEMSQIIATAQKKIKNVEEEAKLSEGVLRETVQRDPGRRAHGREGQGEADRGQPAPGGVDREEVHEPRPAVPGPHPGRQHRPHEGRRQVRLQARLQVLHLRDLVDPPGDHPRHRRPGPHDPHSGPHDRDDEQAHPHQPLPGAGAGTRTVARRDRREDGASSGQGPEGPEAREGADLAGHAHRRRRGLAPRRLHRGQERDLARRRGHLHGPGRADAEGAGDADAARGEGACACASASARSPTTRWKRWVRTSR